MFCDVRTLGATRGNTFVHGVRFVVGKESATSKSAAVDSKIQDAAGFLLRLVNAGVFMRQVKL